MVVEWTGRVHSLATKPATVHSLTADMLQHTSGAFLKTLNTLYSYTFSTWEYFLQSTNNIQKTLFWKNNNMKTKTTYTLFLFYVVVYKNTKIKLNIAERFKIYILYNVLFIIQSGLLRCCCCFLGSLLGFFLIFVMFHLCTSVILSSTIKPEFQASKTTSKNNLLYFPELFTGCCCFMVKIIYHFMEKYNILCFSSN